MVAEPPDGQQDCWTSAWDEALARLEDFLLTYPRDRSLPDLPTIMARAELPERFLPDDERARKVLSEAIAARPLGTAEQVSSVRAEVELLILQVGVLAERLRHTHRADDLDDVRRRLAVVRRRVAELRELL